MQRNSNLNQNIDGGALLSLIVLCGVIAAYLHYFYIALYETQGLVADVILFILITAVVFCFFGAVCIWLRGGKSSSGVKRENKSRMKELAELIDETEARLIRYEQSLPTHKIQIRADGLASLSEIRKILGSLKERYQQAGNLIVKKNRISNIEAWEVLNGNLDACDDCYNSLIQAERHSLDIPADRVAKKVNELFAKVAENSEEVDVSVPLQRMVA